MAANAPLCGNILKRAIALDSGITSSAAPCNSADGSSRPLPEIAQAGLSVILPLHVVHDKQIEMAVIIDIYPGRRDCPQRSKFRIVRMVQSRLRRNIGEGSVPVVVVQGVMVHTGYEEVGKSVIVVVAYRDANVES